MLCSLVFLTMLCRGNVMSFHVKSNRLLYAGFSGGFQTQKLVFVAGSFQKRDVVPACIKKMPIDYLLASDRSAGGGQARLAWLAFVSSPGNTNILVRKGRKITLSFQTLKLVKGCDLSIAACVLFDPGRLYGADDFLPVLTYVLAQGDTLELDTETEYMVELLDPSLLHGEGGFFLTSFDSEARDTLQQCHKRRTSNRTIPSVDDFQNYLRVAFQEVNGACTGKTLLVRPYITTADVCQLCTEKFKVDNPEEYSLFLFVDDTWQQLTEDAYPQKIKAELHCCPQPQVFHVVYKRINSDLYGAVFQNNDE
uniref:Ras-associating domain-containing protein n=1 Tax=Falco tinnunculus TaxID=100819 RepID=A0A8C4TZU9_FALTI